MAQCTTVTLSQVGAAVAVLTPPAGAAAVLVAPVGTQVGLLPPCGGFIYDGAFALYDGVYDYDGSV